MYPELTRDEVFMIGTRRLWLRWPRNADAAHVATFSGDPKVATSTGSWPVGATEAFARERIAATRAANADGTGLGLVIALRSQWERPIGFVGIGVKHDDRGSYGYVGYHLAPEHWDRGYMSEALKGVIDMTRLLSHLPRLKASVMPDNTASADVLRKNGFRYAGNGEITSPFLGTFKVDHYERNLRAIGYDADGLRISPRSMRPQTSFETDVRVS